MIAGSEIITGWKQQNATTYMTYWPYNLGSCPIPSGWYMSFAPITLRREVVMVNGVPLTQVMHFNDMLPGTFYLGDRYHLLHIAPPAGTDMSTAVVEAAVRPKTLTVSGRSDVVLRGLAFEHAANCFNTTSASVNSSSNVLVDSITSEWNNWGGFGVFGSNSVTVQNSLASYNGGVGFMGTRDQNLLFSSNESDYNNWRGAQGAFYDWAAGGTKFFQMRDTSVQNHLSYNNEAEGLWFDTDDQRITINQATLSGNVLAGLQIERNKGPITLQNSYLCNNGVGLNLLTSRQTTVKNNTFYNNGGTNTHQAQIFLGGNSGGISIVDWLTGIFDNLVTTGTVLSGNLIEDNGDGQSVVGTYLNASDWAQFTSTLTSDYNQWYDPQTGSAFKVAGGRYVTLPTWQSDYGTDQNSYWGPPAVSPSGACWVPSAAFPDFQVVLNNDTIYMTGGAGTATVNVRSFGYGPVTLWLRGLPWGVNAAFSQNNLVSGMVTIRLSASSVGSQTVPVTLWAVSGSRVHTITFNLAVT
ncbi:MAG TPA: right-handed parallel beta-helix repeat-containing protein [Terracidiphilus sp.]|nr:right-handed parallel beta-helix repeat-containing protein [Terracidiphilus sp.]